MSNDKEMGKAFSEGIKIALVGGDWSKGIQDHAEQYGPFPSDSRLRHFVRHEQPPTMSNAEAIEILMHIEADIYGRIAIGKAIDALLSPWVKTEDRPPTHKDAYLHEKVLAKGRDDRVVMAYYAHVRDFPNLYILWAPIPPLPEVPND